MRYVDTYFDDVCYVEDWIIRTRKKHSLNLSNEYNRIKKQGYKDENRRYTVCLMR